MIRVLHLTTHLNAGGITVYIQKLIKPLRELGIETFVLSSGGDWISTFHERGAATLELPIRTKSELHPKLYLHLPQVIRWARGQKIDLLHAHTRVTQVMAYWIHRCTKIPVVTTCHGFYKPRLGRRLLPAWGDKVIAISEAVAESLQREFHLPEHKIATVYNGIDLDELDANYKRHHSSESKRKYGLNPTDTVLGITARLVEDKGHEYLLRALAALKPGLPSLRALIVGEGRQRASLENLSSKLHVEKEVVFAGSVSDVSEPLSAIDIFVLPATWREGFGLSIVEAMACQKPVIVTNIWALNTLIQDNVTGMMVEPKQVEPLAQAILKCVQNPTFARTLAQNGYEMVKRLFPIKRMAQEIADVYHSVLGETQSNKKRGAGFPPHCTVDPPRNLAGTPAPPCATMRPL